MLSLKFKCNCLLQNKSLHKPFDEITGPVLLFLIEGLYMYFLFGGTESNPVTEKMGKSIPSLRSIHFVSLRKQN